MRHRRNRNGKAKKLCALGAAAVLALSIGIAALAEQPADVAAEDAVESSQAQSTEQARPNRMGKGWRMGSLNGGIDIGSLDQSQLTDDQKQALSAALSAYDAAEDAVLDEMVAAGALARDAADSYRRQRSAQREIADKDYSNWTLDQLSALRQAISRGSVNETVLAGLVSQGVITQAEADTIKLAYGESVNIWGQVDTSKATQGMLTKLSEAQAAYRQALTGAGILAERGTDARGMNGMTGKNGGRGRR